jgi:hypothetical protein
MKWAVLIFLGLMGYVVSGVVADDSKYTTVTATVQSVDWRCGLKSRSRTSSTDDFADCSTEPDFQRRRENPSASGKRFAGKAVVGATYAAAKGGIPEQAVFSIDAARAEFYTIEQGVTVRIGVNKADPEDVRFVDIVRSAG